jgi:hypothetical protein
MIAEQAGYEHSLRCLADDLLTALLFFLGGRGHESLFRAR